MSAFSTLLFGAFSSSSSYQLQSYGLGSGGTNNSSSQNYSLNATSGEIGGMPSTGATTKAGSGSTETRQANVPLAPTLSNGSNTYYNKLQVIINTSGSDASDYTYSIAVSTNNFSTTNYVQADGTFGANPVYQSYATWGGASGSFIIGLSPNTAYQAKVDAMQGTFSNSAYGPSASATTANPSLTFSISPSTVNMGSLLPGTVTPGASDISFTFATNGASGGSVYVAGANSGLKSTAANNIIASASANLTTQSEGFGLQGLTTGQTSGGPLGIVAPFNGTSNTVGAVASSFKPLFSASTAVVGGTATAGVKGKASTTTPSGSDYVETLTFIASASF